MLLTLCGLKAIILKVLRHLLIRSTSSYKLLQFEAKEYILHVITLRKICHPYMCVMQAFCISTFQSSFVIIWIQVTRWLKPMYWNTLERHWVGAGINYWHFMVDLKGWTFPFSHKRQQGTATHHSSILHFAKGSFNIWLHAKSENLIKKLLKLVVVSLIILFSSTEKHKKV